MITIPSQDVKLNSVYFHPESYQQKYHHECVTVPAHLKLLGLFKNIFALGAVFCMCLTM